MGLEWRVGIGEEWKEEGEKGIKIIEKLKESKKVRMSKGQ
jgi:hypothetical protein